MRKTIIAASVAAIVLLSSAFAHAQVLMDPSTPVTESVPAIFLTGSTATFSSDSEITVGDLYYAGKSAGARVMSGSTIVENFHATTDSFSSLGNAMRFSGDGNIQNFWLQVGRRDIVTTVDGLGTNPFGPEELLPSYHTAGITLTDTSVQVGTTTVRQGNTWLRDNTEFGVNVVSNGTVGTLTMRGGSVGNAGAINNLVVGGGAYSGLGTVDNLRFESDGGVFTISGWAGDDDFGFMNVKGTADLTNASRLSLNLTGMLDGFDVREGIDAWESTFFGKFGEDALSWEKIFGTENVENVGAVNFLSINWGDKDNLIGWNSETGWTGTGSHIWAFGKDGIVVSASSPEPATLVVIGLGFAGLGSVCRRRKNMVGCAPL